MIPFVQKFFSPPMPEAEGSTIEQFGVLVKESDRLLPEIVLDDLGVFTFQLQQHLGKESPVRQKRDSWREEPILMKLTRFVSLYCGHLGP